MKFEDVEKARVVYKEKRNKYFLISISILLAVSIIISFAVNADNFFALAIFSAFLLSLFFSVVIAFLIVSFATANEAKAYKKSYKTYFVTRSMQKTFTNLNYNHELGLDKQILKDTQMINTGDRYSSNDLTIGKYKDVGFTQADVHIEIEHRDSEGNITYSTLFKGRFMIFEFPKKFNFRLEVMSRFCRVGRIPGKDPETGRKFEKFEVESIDFNKKFKIYAEDGFETFYLLDPAFIERIEKFSSEYNKSIILCFINNRLYVGINDGKDSLEPPSPSKPIDEQAEVAKVEQDIKLITNFVDELKLDQKIFK